MPGGGLGGAGWGGASVGQCRGELADSRAAVPNHASSTSHPPTRPTPPKALLAYIRSGLEPAAYWDALAAGGVTAARLASFDRPITHEPGFTPGGWLPG
jgi:hypothetical protein